MKAATGHVRWSAIVLTAMLFGALLAVPSAVAQGGASADKQSASAPTERILVFSTNPSDKAKPAVLAWGPIHAKGKDISVNNHKDIFRFPNGDLIIRHQKVTRARHRDPVVCLSRFMERGTYQIVRGTGDYVGAHGHGHYSVHVKFIACAHQRPEAFVLQIRAHGPLRL